MLPRPPGRPAPPNPLLWDLLPYWQAWNRNILPVRHFDELNPNLLHAFGALDRARARADESRRAGERPQESPQAFWERIGREVNG